MFRTNGGLIGGKRLTSLSAAPGVWSVAEQVTQARAVQWPGQSPVAGLSPLSWYDFADASTVTLSGSQINTIADKGSRGLTLSKSTTGPLYSDGINGLKCCNWGSGGHSNYLRNASTTSTTFSEAYFVLDADFGSTFTTYNGLFSGITSSAWHITGAQGAADFFNDGGFNFAYLNGSGTNSFDTAILPTINSPTLLRVTTTVLSPVTTTAGLQLGMDRAYTGRGWSGFFGEVIIFQSHLSSTDRATLQNYLAKKWALTIV